MRKVSAFEFFMNSDSSNNWFNNSIIFIVDNSKDKNIVGFNNSRVYENKMNVDYIYDLNENKCTSTS